MRRITQAITALALSAFVGNSAWAQDFTPVTSLDDVTTGWYQIKVGEGTRDEHSANTGKLIATSPNPYRVSSGGGAGIYGIDVVDNTDDALTTLLYVTNFGNGTFSIQLLNGYFAGDNATSYTAQSSYSITQKESGSEQFHIASYWSVYLPAGRKLIGKYTDASSDFFQLSHADDIAAGYDIYTVYVYGAGSSTPTVDCNSTYNQTGISQVINGGKFIFPKNTPMSVSDFAASEITDKTAHISIVEDSQQKYIIVQYSSDADSDASEEDINAAKKLLSKGNAIGHPFPATSAHSQVAVLLNQSNIKTEALSQAVTAYKSTSTTLLQMPEDGKVYTITFRPADLVTGTYRYLNFTGSGLDRVATTLNTKLPTSAQFVCHTWVNDEGVKKYVFVPAYSEKTNFEKYLNYQGVSDKYNAERVGVNDCTIEPMTKYLTETNNHITTKTAENLFGYVFIKFDKRSDRNDETQGGVYIIDENGAFSKSKEPFLTTSYTSALIMEEVTDYPNEVTLNAVTEDDKIFGVKAIATFSAPYNAVIPAGVTAWKVSGYNSENQEVGLVALEGEAIPAGTGVLLTADEANKVTMVPATSETPADVSDNWLDHSAGIEEGKSLKDIANAYILTRVNGVAGFYLRDGQSDNNLPMNKAYLALPEGTTPASVRMSFGDVTGIVQVGTSADTDHAPLYDLSGRRVTAAQKGGIYIQNGKKFIVK